MTKKAKIKREDLSNDIKDIICNSNKDTLENNIEILGNCRKIILEYKDNGLTQYDAYDKIFSLYKLYNESNMETETTFVADILDIICGNIGNEKWLIWNEYFIL